MSESAISFFFFIFIFLINWNTNLVTRLWFSCLYWSWDIEYRTKLESAYRKYNSFFDLKTKLVLKYFYFSFFNFITKIEKSKNFLKFIIWFEIKKWIQEFWFFFFFFFFFNLVLNKNRLKKNNFFFFLFFQFNNQIW